MKRSKKVDQVNERTAPGEKSKASKLVIIFQTIQLLVPGRVKEVTARAA